MSLQITNQLQQEMRQYRDFVNQFGPLSTPDEQTQAQQRYLAWLATPEATLELLRDPWKGAWAKQQ